MPALDVTSESLGCGHGAPRRLRARPSRAHLHACGESRVLDLSHVYLPVLFVRVHLPVPLKGEIAIQIPQGASQIPRGATQSSWPRVRRFMTRHRVKRKHLSYKNIFQWTAAPPGSPNSVARREWRADLMRDLVKSAKPIPRLRRPQSRTINLPTPVRLNSRGAESLKQNSDIVKLLTGARHRACEDRCFRHRRHHARKVFEPRQVPGGPR